VTVLADPELKAKALVEELEAIDGPKHYSEVDAIEELLREAEDAVSIIQDPITKVKLQADVLAEAARITGILDRYVKAVQNALLESDLELLEALGTFWDIDEKLIGTYQRLMIAANTEGELETVHDIQAIIEKAPEEAAKDEEAKKKAEAAAKIVEAAREDSHIDFRNALIQYGEYLERVNLEHDDENYTILKEYKEAIKVISEGIEKIQEAIDRVNRGQAKDAVQAAVNSLERSDWTRANTLVAYMADDEAEAEQQPKKDAQDALAKLDLVLEVVEAAQNGELRDLYGALEELELEEDVEASLVMAYRDAIVGGMDQLKGENEISAVITELENIIKAENNVFDRFEVKVTKAKVGEDLEITVNALNRLGKVKEDFDFETVTVIGVSPIGVPDNAEFSGGTAQLSFGDPFEKIGKVSAVLKFSMGDEPDSRVEYAVPFEITVTADPKDGIVTTDAKEYTAGDMIEITVKLLYEEQQPLKHLDTLNGEYPAEITIGDRYYSKLLTFTNGVAVAEVRAEEAEEVGEEDELEYGQQQVKVRVEFEGRWVEMTTKPSVKIQAGDAVKLDVTGIYDDDLLGARLEAQDAYGNRVLTYEGSRTIKVTYELKGTGVTAAGYQYEIDPDGQVAVVFSKGQTDVSYGEFKFAPDLEDEKTYTFTFTVVEDGLTGTTDYTRTPE
jgi:hypothetical protein